MISLRPADGICSRQYSDVGQQPQQTAPNLRRAGGHKHHRRPWYGGVRTLLPTQALNANLALMAPCMNPSSSNLKEHDVLPVCARRTNGSLRLCCTQRGRSLAGRGNHMRQQANLRLVNASNHVPGQVSRSFYQPCHGPCRIEACFSLMVPRKPTAWQKEEEEPPGRESQWSTAESSPSGER